MTPRVSIAVCVALVAALAASCTELPPDSAAARTVDVTAEPSSSPIPREFLELGVDAPSRVGEQPRATEVPAPRSLERSAWVLRAEGNRLVVWTDPRAKDRTRTKVDAVNPWGQQVAFPVTQVAIVQGDAWYRVLLGIAPNGSRGWVRAGDVTFHRVRHRVTIDLSERALRHYRNGHLRHRFSVGVGAAATPTTTGRFFVWAVLEPRDPTGPYGSYLLGLSGFSEVLTDWPGGGRIAIHGTADPSDRGRPVSHGCTRVYNLQMDRLRNIPMGTTVTIQP
ncbi:MAG: L,D-transpeptidase [Actinomycetota bacterium]